MHPSTRIVIGEAIVLVALLLSPAAGWVPLADISRPVLVLGHVLGVVLFLGNAVVGALLLGMADAHGEASVLRFVSSFVGWADAAFTGPGALLVLVTGLALCAPLGGWGATDWLGWSVAAFVLSGAIWVFTLVPMQQRMISRSRIGDLSGWRRLARVYIAPGVLSIVLLLAALALMVLKLPLG
jgi:uncharacterized membrane protein